MSQVIAKTMDFTVGGRIVSPAQASNRNAYPWSGAGVPPALAGLGLMGLGCSDCGCPSCKGKGISGLDDMDSPMRALFGVAYLAAIGASAYHGYRRVGTVGGALGWAVLGALAPIITVPVAMAQGFGDPR